MDEINESRLIRFAAEKGEPITLIKAKNYPESAKDKSAK